MSSEIKILAVDDDSISRKMIGRALTDSDFSLSFAEDGETGLSMALQELPDIIILDVEMPGMNGYEVCVQLRTNDLTREIPVVFLSSHSTLRERMQGYEVGANDYLVKPFENEDLIAKMRILARYSEEHRILKERYHQAERTAMIALTGTSELSLAMNFVEKSQSFVQYNDLAEALLQLCLQLQLNCILLILEDQEKQWYSLDDAISPLEKEMISMVDRGQRQVDFGSRTILNYHNLSLLVKNMPLEDMDRYGRMKDLLPLLLNAVDNRINAIRTDIALNGQQQDLLLSFSQIRGRLYFLAKKLIEKQQQSNDTLQKLVSELNTDLIGMGLEDDQEAYLLDRLDSAIEQAAEKIDSSTLLYYTFTQILDNLKQISAQQEELQQLFSEMNAHSASESTIEDDGVEFF